MENVLTLPNFSINLNVFDTIGKDLVKVNSHIKKDIKVVTKIGKHSLATAFKIAGNSSTDSVKEAFLAELIQAAASQYGATMTSAQAQLVAEALTKGVDEILTAAGNSIEPATTSATTSTVS